MVEQPSHLTVVQGEGGPGSHLPTVGTSPSTAVFPPFDTVQDQTDQGALEAFEARMNRHKLDRLRHEHSTALFAAELSVEKLKLDQAFELIVFEASVNGVPHRVIQGVHTDARETLDTVTEKVS